MRKFDLTWGESVVVRQRFLEQADDANVKFSYRDLASMDYTPFNGDQELINETAKVIFRQTGQTYKHVFLTNGASGGCAIALRAFLRLDVKEGFTYPGPFFALYPAMMRAAGLKHSTYEPETDSNSVFLLDSPSNPLGLHLEAPNEAKYVIWDAVYHNRVYSKLAIDGPRHDVVVGSYSKLTGINGIRLGWIATNDDILALIIQDLLAPEYCGLSKPSMEIMLQLLQQYDDYTWTMFEQQANYSLDCNREQWAKLEKYFGGTPVPVNGMFYYGQMDEAAKKLFEKAGIGWQSGLKCGDSDDFGRFNLGQDALLIKEAVKSVLKIDKI